MTQVTCIILDSGLIAQLLDKDQIPAPKPGTIVTVVELNGDTWEYVAEPA